jgi:DNA-binding NarL/FixJ family response regulator
LPRVVLLVDHGPTLRTVVRLHLADGGAFDAAEFVEARDAAGAVEVLRSRAVHLVIAEVGGGAAARATLEALREAVAPRGVPMVLVAARPGHALVAAAGAFPGCALVEKPVTAPRLRAAIDAVMAGNTDGSPRG